jgi:hypothetical protein
MVRTEVRLVASTAFEIIGPDIAEQRPRGSHQGATIDGHGLKKGVIHAATDDRYARQANASRRQSRP